jgi:hypothetical protein
MAFFKEGQYLLNAAHASGDEYATPTTTFGSWDDYMLRRIGRRFTVDAFASPSNHKIRRFHTKRKRDDGLARNYPGEVVFANPPFSKGGILRATTLAVIQCRDHAATFGMVLPNWTSDPWFVQNVLPFASELHFIPGRIRFLGENGKPSFSPTDGSIFVIWFPSLREPGTDIKTFTTACPTREELLTWDPSRRQKVIRRDGTRLGPIRRVLVACESSGRVRDSFLKRGYDAWSCDLMPTDVPGPHLRCDVRAVLDDGWDLMIGFPPCTYLAVSGAAWFAEREQEQAEALEFVRTLMAAPIPRIAIENPVSVISSHIREPDQMIHPWMFGHGETKRTCLWLKNLPRLMPSEIVSGREQRVLMMTPSPDRSKRRSLTYSGIAEAMATQWS